MRLVVERASREPEDARNYGRQAIVTSSPSNRLGGVDGASFCKRLTSQTENVSGRVHVTVMNRSAIATDPFSYSKAFQSLRTADAFAFGTDLSAEVFGGVHEHRCARNRLIPQHVARHP